MNQKTEWSIYIGMIFAPWICLGIYLCLTLWFNW